MSKRIRPRKKKERGVALIVTFGLMTLITLAAATYIDHSTSSIRMARHNMLEVQTTHLCEAGAQVVLRDLWKPFKKNQNFSNMDTVTAGATETTPKNAETDKLPGVGRYAAGIIGSYSPGGDSYARIITVRSVGWIDTNNNGVADADEPRKTVDVTAEFRLARSQVFDYTYFINNFGWMQGFTPSQLIVNGDMRSNGDFSFISGSGTINGTVVASANDKLVPGASGIINAPPYKWANSTYKSATNGSVSYASRMRPVYNSTTFGDVGSTEFTKWRDLVFQSDSSLVDSKTFGAALMDSSGTKAWQNTGGAVTTNLLDPRPTQEVIMPDLKDFGSLLDAPDSSGGRFAKSKAYEDSRETFADGTPNPNYKGAAGAQNEFNAGVPNVNYKGAYVDVWNSTTSSYMRVSSNGVVANSALLIGTAAHPIRIHGPVAVNGDVALAGTISGQGTLYTKRNVHIIGSIKYSNPPDFRGSDPNAVDKSVEKKDFLGLAANGSVIMGDTTSFGSYPLNYMKPPFTKPRYDDDGNLIPAYDATQLDGYGIKKYQSLLEFGATATAYKNAAAGGVNQVDAILYTNFVGGGNVGTSGGGMTLNGSIISRDEAIVTWSLPIVMNYDTRIRERDLTKAPLIDLDLPRSPTVLRSTWQDRGFISN